MAELSIQPLNENGLHTHLQDLADILQASVQAGASVGFVAPFTLNDSRAFWLEDVLPAIQTGARILLIAALEQTITGTVQLQIEMRPNQQHRCEVAKLLVHPNFRSRGIAKRLMADLEHRAQAIGKTLITLDTRTGDTAEPLYRALGYQTAGSIPGYCRAPAGDRYDATTYMYKSIAA